MYFFGSKTRLLAIAGFLLAFIAATNTRQFYRGLWNP